MQVPKVLVDSLKGHDQEICLECPSALGAVLVTHAIYMMTATLVTEFIIKSVKPIIFHQAFFDRVRADSAIRFALGAFQFYFFTKKKKIIKEDPKSISF